MNHRSVALVIVATFISFITFFLAIEWFSSRPNLTILLRCMENVSGTLHITLNTEQHIEEIVDIQSACNKGEIKFSGYISEENINLIFEHDNAHMGKIISEYGSDIQVDNDDGFYMVLEITDSPPFIANDRI